MRPVGSGASINIRGIGVSLGFRVLGGNSFHLDLLTPHSIVHGLDAIGPGFARTTRVHYMPQGSTPLPAIATMLGPRIVPEWYVRQLEESHASKSIIKAARRALKTNPV